MDELKKFFFDIPPFTRYFMTGVFASSFCMTYGILSPYAMLLDFESVFKKLQLWRLITTYLFAGRFSQSFLFTMVMMYFTMRRTEEYFKSKYPDFVTLVVFLMFATMFYSFIYGEYMVLNSSFIFALMYVWCKLEPDL